MSDREKKIAEIREALEKATQGPWKWIDPGGLERKKLVGEWEIMNFGIGGVYDQVAGSEPDEDDAHLIANAPEWLGFLLDELERLEREYAEERAAHNAHVTELCELEEENRKLREERDNLQQAYDDAEMRASDAISERNDAQQEIERLREERDAYYNNARYTEAAFHEVTSPRSQLQSAQQEIERLGNLARQERELADHWMRKHHDDVVKLREEREKLIEGLRWYADEENQKLDEGTRHWENVYSPYEMDGGQRARDILKEIGVTDV